MVGKWLVLWPEVHSGSISNGHALYYNRVKFTTADNDNDERPVSMLTSTNNHQLSVHLYIRILVCTVAS